MLGTLVLLSILAMLGIDLYWKDGSSSRIAFLTIGIILAVWGVGAPEYVPMILKVQHIIYGLLLITSVILFLPYSFALYVRSKIPASDESILWITLVIFAVAGSLMLLQTIEKGDGVSVALITIINCYIGGNLIVQLREKRIARLLY